MIIKNLNLKKNRNSDTKVNSKNYYNYGNLVEVFTLIGGLGKIDLAPSLYLNVKKKSNKKYIVIHTSSNESDRNWNSLGWNSIIDKLVNDKNMIVYELGFQKQYNKQSPFFVDFTGQKSLDEIFTYDFENIVMSHGYIMTGGAKDRLLRALRERGFNGG